jgi:hypothetical protein
MRMFANRKLRMAAVALAVMAGATGQALAGTGQGTVGSVLVGRLGHEVYVQVVNPTFNTPACATTGTWHFYFSTQNQAGRDMLATVLFAKATGIQLIFVGTGACSLGPDIQDVSYIITL